MTNTQELELLQRLLTPVVTKHGLERGVKIMEAVGTVVVAMQAWPEDIRDDALEALLSTLDTIKEMASEPSKAA